jgi:hypothetical protein
MEMYVGSRISGYPKEPWKRGYNENDQLVDKGNRWIDAYSILRATMLYVE